MQGFGFRVWGLEFGVQSLGAQVATFRVPGLKGGGIKGVYNISRSGTPNIVCL